MSNIRFDYSKALPFVGQHEIDNMAEYVKEAHNMLHNKTGAGNDFLGWVNLPTDYDKEEFARIKKAAEKIRSDSDVLVVIGIGVRTLVQERLLKCYNIHSIMLLTKTREKVLLFSLPEITSVRHIWLICLKQ